jgi:hypothetical protein
VWIENFPCNIETVHKIKYPHLPWSLILVVDGGHYNDIPGQKKKTVVVVVVVVEKMIAIPTAFLVRSYVAVVVVVGRMLAWVGGADVHGDVVGKDDHTAFVVVAVDRFDATRVIDCYRYSEADSCHERPSMRLVRSWWW